LAAGSSNITSVANSSTTVGNPLVTAFGGNGGIYSTIKSSTGGAGGYCSNSPWSFNNGSGINSNGGAGGQGSQNGSSTTNSSNQALYGLSSDLIKYTLPDKTICYFSGGGGGGSSIYNGTLAPTNYAGGAAGHGYGGLVGANYNNNNTINVNGQNAVIFGSGGGGGSSNIASNNYTTGGKGGNGLVLFIIPMS
jgi:hypothetical protein